MHGGVLISPHPCRLLSFFYSLSPSFLPLSLFSFLLLSFLPISFFLPPPSLPPSFLSLSFFSFLPSFLPCFFHNSQTRKGNGFPPVLWFAFTWWLMMLSSQPLPCPDTNPDSSFHPPLHFALCVPHFLLLQIDLPISFVLSTLLWLSFIDALGHGKIHDLYLPTSLLERTVLAVVTWPIPWYPISVKTKVDKRFRSKGQSWEGKKHVTAQSPRGSFRV